MMMNQTIHRDDYYTSMEHFIKMYDKYGRRNKFKASSVEEYNLWKEEIRGTLKELIGLDMMETCDLEPRLLEKTILSSGITREKMLIQVEPNVFMPFYVLTPKELPKDKGAHCIIAPHGHQGGGKYAVAGVHEVPGISEKITFFNYDYGVQLALMGYVVLCPDARGFGERRELAKQGEDAGSILNSTCFHLAHMAEPLGQTVIGMCTWDLMRMIDYIETRKDWDSSHIGCAGFSGGGMQTLWLTALDDRIKYSIISGYMYGYKDSLLKLNGNCSCNYVPHLWKHVDMGDIGALIAPRPVMIQSCKADHLNGERGIINAIEQVDIMREAYKLFNCENNIVHDLCEGGHRWHEENVQHFLQDLV